MWRRRVPKDLSFYVAQVVGALVMQTASSQQQLEAAQEQLAEKDRELAELKKPEPSA